jgi:hypothetical protein
MPRRRDSSRAERQDIRSEERVKPLTKQWPEAVVVKSPVVLSKENSRRVGTKSLAEDLLATLEIDARVNNQAKDVGTSPMIDSVARVSGEDPDLDLAY